MAFTRLPLLRGLPSTASDYGRKWMAWLVFIGTLSTLPRFFRHFDAESFARWVIVVLFCGAAAFVAGWIYGKFCGKEQKTTSDADQGDLIVESEPLSKSVETRLAELKVLRKKQLISQEKSESKGNLMNKKQRKLLIIISSVIGLMVAFPPYVMERNGNIVSSGFSFIVDLPYRSTFNVSMLFAEMIGALIIGAILFFIFKE